jgi:hypothetical protein
MKTALILVCIVMCATFGIISGAAPMCRKCGGIGMRVKWPKEVKTTASKVSALETAYSILDTAMDGEPFYDAITSNGECPGSEETCDDGSYCVEIAMKEPAEDGLEMSFVWSDCLNDFIADMGMSDVFADLNDETTCEAMKAGFCKDMKGDCFLQCADDMGSMGDPLLNIWEITIGFSSVQTPVPREKRATDVTVDESYYLGTDFEDCLSVIQGYLSLELDSAIQNVEGVDDLYELGEYTLLYKVYFAKYIYIPRKEVEACVKQFMKSDGNGVKYQVVGESASARFGLSMATIVGALIAFVFA